MKAKLEALMSSDRMDWETPQKLFDELNAEFRFDIDLAANETNHKCTRYFGPGSPIVGGENALAISWYGYRGWLNPPYGKELPEWIARAYNFTRNDKTLVVMLIPARTDTRYWHDYVMKAEEVRFLKGRLKFVGAKSSAPFPSAIIVFGNKEGERR